MAKTKYISISALIFLFQFFSLTVLANIPEQPDDPTIKFGLMKKDSDGRYYVYSETTNIPFVLSDSNFRFGFEVQHLLEGNYIGTCIIYSPSSLDEISVTRDQKNVPLEYKANENNGIIKMPDVEYKKFWWLDILFDEKDPLGIWKIEIYVNDELKQTIKFNVQ